MESGKISAWKVRWRWLESWLEQRLAHVLGTQQVKEGDSFSVGDVLLTVETDKGRKIGSNLLENWLKQV